VLIVMKQNYRTFVEQLDFVTSAGHVTGGDSRALLRCPGRGPTAVITDLCIMRPDPVSRELTVSEIHPGVTRDQIGAATGWPIRFAEQVTETARPADAELTVLRDLLERTHRAHGDA
jgi:glutaconate CoA-transferase, subunit B